MRLDIDEIEGPGGPPSINSVIDALDVLHRARLACPWKVSPAADDVRAHPLGGYVAKVEVDERIPDKPKCRVVVEGKLIADETGEAVLWESCDEAKDAADAELKARGYVLLERKKDGKLAVTDPALVYSEDFGDDRVCACGHPYYRHFDTYDEMRNVGCKYCHDGECEGFKEKA